MTSTKTTGHRSRLRSRWLEGDKATLTDESLLELLLTYAIPRKDVQPLARQLLSKFGDIKSVIQANVENLCEIKGIGEQAAILIKVVDHFTKLPSDDEIQIQIPNQVNLQLSLSFPAAFESTSEEPENVERIPKKVSDPEQVTKAPLFANAVLKEAIQLLPALPEEAETLAEARHFFRERLHYSATSTRQRNSAYMARRMFPNGQIDQALALFAKRFANTQTLREVCFYRFIKAEPLAARILEHLFVPRIGQGKLGRNEVKNYLQALFPESKSIGNCIKALSAALDAGGIANPKPKEIHFNYRDISIETLAFILHSEYPKPGMYDLNEVEHNSIFKAMLWKPDQLLPGLYELRNSGIINKISNIDQIRHITTRFNLDECVLKLTEIKFGNEPD